MLFGRYNLNIYTLYKYFVLPVVIFFYFSSAETQNVSINNWKPVSSSLIVEIEQVQNFLYYQYPALNRDGSGLMLINMQQSPHVSYYSLQQTFNDLIIYNSNIKIAVNNSGDILFTAGNYFGTMEWKIPIDHQQKLDLPQAQNGSFRSDEEIVFRQIIIVEENNTPKKYFEFDQQVKRDRSRITIIVNENGDLLSQDDHKAYFSVVDSTVVGNVFLPDPLTTEGAFYGGDYIDNNDADNSALIDEQYLVSFKTQFENDTFFLRTDNIMIKDLNTPTTGVVTSLTPAFIFSRSESGFEDVNTFYHILNFNSYISSLGYSGLHDFYIEIDPHGASGADQSFYVSAIIPSIQLGEGGVDDAEDADVILHEYGHGLSDHAAPESNTGLERHAIDEGYCDYFAVSYSRMYSDFNWQNVFSWDGHNEFWAGRNANTGKHYPENNSADIYASSEIWSGALMDIFDGIGKENADKIILESLYGSFANMSMPDAAQVILNSESILFAGTYHDIVYELLDARGLINPVDIDEFISPENVFFKNTNGFSFNNEALIIDLMEIVDFELTVNSVDGKTIFSYSGTTDTIELSSMMFNKGIFIVTVVTKSGIFSEKIIKF